MIYRSNQPTPPLRVRNSVPRPKIVRIDDHDYIFDPTLGGYPVLSTPDRLNADTRYTGRGVTIAFIDSGFYPHPDLTEPANRIVAVYDAVNDRIEEEMELPATFDPPVEAWHGTMTSCAAVGNGRRSNGIYRGVASDAHAVFVKTMTPDFRIRTPEVVRALKWVRKNLDNYDIRIVSMSVGVDEIALTDDHPVIVLIDELVSLGVTVVAAAGNNPERPLKPPGAARNAITVGGLSDGNSDDVAQRTLWSGSFGHSPDGALKPDLIAPAIFLAAPILPNSAVKAEADALFMLATQRGPGLMRTVKRVADRTKVADALLAAKTAVQVRNVVFRRIMDEKLISAEYKHVDGTSFAAALVSSVIAQLLEAQPRLGPDEIRYLLTASAEPLPGVPRERQGAGSLNADGAIALLEKSLS